MIFGFTTEGPTDERFLESIIQRTFEEISLECTQSIEVFPIVVIPKGKGEFIPRYEKALEVAFGRGLMALCIHVDADDSNNKEVFRTRFDPLRNRLLERKGDSICEVVVPVVPVHMTEAWILADIELLKDEIGTALSNQDLGLHRQPEKIADPKEVIQNAIRIANEGKGRRNRRELDLPDIYQLIGRKIELSQLRKLSSYLLFEESVRAAYRQLSYLQ